MSRTHLAAPLLGAFLLAAPAAAQGNPPADSVRAKRPTRLNELVITATRTSEMVSSSPLAVTAVTRADLSTSSAPSVPNLLWRIPGFTMRDYQSSVLSSTARMIPAFRGLSGSTAGRTLVLLDGVPLNEAFSGRLNWSRIPLSLVDRIEVVRGGGSMLWGSRALGGVINVLTATPSRTSLSVQAEGGEYSTYRGAAAGSFRDGKLSASLSTDWSGTDGVITVPKDKVGPIDIPNGARDRVVYGKLAYDFTPGIQAYLSGNYLHERGSGPTPLSDGRSNISELRAGTRITTAGRGVFEVAGYANRFRSSFVSSTISSDRSTATLSRTSAIPAHSAGSSIQWSSSFAGGHQVTAGWDFSRTNGEVDEAANYSGGQMTLERDALGKQWLTGVFLQDHLNLTDRWKLLAGLRFDALRNYAGRRTDTDLVHQSTTRDTLYPSRTFNRLNWSLGIRHSAAAWLDWRASAYAAFRAPSLYELYQSNYSSRGTVTAANPDLLSERLLGAELGLDLNLGEAVLARTTFFWNQVHDPIIDYTIGTATSANQVIDPCGALPKGQVCRQRRNVDGLRTTGIESEVEYHPVRDLSFWLSYTFNPTRITAKGQEVDGKVARGAARHAASSVVTYDNPKLFGITFEERYVGSRSDDDLDTIRLDGFWVSGLRINRRLWRGSSAYLKVDNLFNATYEVTRSSSGLAEIGSPRWATVGLRAAW